MEFSLIKIDKPNRLKKLSSNLSGFLASQKEDISIFHYNELDNGLFHVVLNINDEYEIGTKKLGRQHNYPYSSLINLFFLPKYKYALIEYINENYLNDVLNFIRSKTKSELEISTINNSTITNMYNSLSGKVKKIEYTNTEGELFDKDFVDEKMFFDIVKDNNIDRVTLSIQDRMLSLTSTGKIVIDNSNEKFLINFTKRILSLIV